MSSNTSYSMYCIKECPLGIEQSKRFIERCESAWDAVFDMQKYIDHCDCPYESERQEYDAKSSNK